MLVSSDWAHASAIKRWAGTSIPGYLDGVEVLTSDGLSHTLLAAYVPPGSSHIFGGALIPVRGLSLFLELTRQSRTGLCKAQTRDLGLGCRPFAHSWSRGPLAAALLPAAARRSGRLTRHGDAA